MANSLLSGVLQPLSQYYEDVETVEVRINEPGFVVVDNRGKGKTRIEDPHLTLGEIEKLCKALANSRGLQFDGEKQPVLSCVLDGGHRFQCAVGKSVQTEVSMSIRCKHPFTPTWEQLGVTDQLQGYIRDIVDTSQNILISGATNTGKTTLLNRMLGFLPDDRRVVAVEDTPEIHLNRFWDGVGLLAAREEKADTGLMSWRQHYDHSMRITPDHIIFGEISTHNAFAALGALNSGITGFMCTIHAESPMQALNRKFDQNISFAGLNMNRVPEFLHELIDVVIQIKRDHTGYRRITDIYHPGQERWIMRGGVVESLRDKEL